MKNRLVDFILKSQERLALLLGVNAALQLTGKSVEAAATDPRVQFDAQIAWHERFHTPFLQTSMDPTIEAEIFGAQVRYDEGELPTISERLIHNRSELSALIDPKVGHKRTTVPLSAVQWFKEKYPGSTLIVLGSMTGPLTLACQLYGVQETLALVSIDPGLLKELLEISNRFLQRYAWAFREIGADGIILSEPAAGLIPPDSVVEYSSKYVRRIVDFIQNEMFAVVYHNCRANIDHLQPILETGAAVYHFGTPMDLSAVLDTVGDEVIVSGNIDQVGVMLNSDPETVAGQTKILLEATAGRCNFVISASCQLFPGTPLANIDAFYRSIAEYHER